MLKVRFPKKQQQRYYDIHYRYLSNILREAMCNISYDDIPEKNVCVIETKINEKNVLFDFADNGEGINENETSADLIFRFHCKNETSKVKSFCPVSFTDFTLYHKLKNEIQYIHSSDKVLLYNQRAYGNAVERRNKVYDIITKNNIKADTWITEPLKYYQKVTKGYASLHVPGQNNNMLDRAQLQMMSFGMPTLSPYLPEILPYENKLIPEKHYVLLENNYCDIIEKINEIKNNSVKAITISENTKRLFREYFEPIKLVEWIKYNIKRL